MGSGPGDPALLTVHARDVLAAATLAFTDPDVDKGVTVLVGTDLGVDAETGEPLAEVRPALGEPAEVAKTLVHEAKNGHDVVRLVSGDPLTTDSVIAEVTAVARTQVQFEVLPGLPSASAVPSYAGMALGSGHTEADVRGEVDWAALAAAPDRWSCMPRRVISPRRRAPSSSTAWLRRPLPPSRSAAPPASSAPWRQPSRR